jgi:hypothetical protein
VVVGLGPLAVPEQAVKVSGVGVRQLARATLVVEEVGLLRLGATGELISTVEMVSSPLLLGQQFIVLAVGVAEATS